MPRDDYDYLDANSPLPRRRETIMDRSLRRARGEDVDEPLDDYYDDDYADEYYPPRGLDRPVGLPRYARRSGGGCATATLYLVLGGLVTLIILLFVLRGTVSSIGDFFSASTPDIAALIATPTPTVRVNAAAVVQRVQRLNRLETTSYTIEKVIESEQTSNVPWIGDWLSGDRLLLVAHGTVVAGIDLSQLRPEDVLVAPDGSTVTVRLPQVEIFSATLDNNQTRVYDRQRGWFAPDNKDLETLARQTAEAEILKAACEDGIMQRAHQDSQRTMEQFLSLLDVDAVIIEAAPVPACPTSTAPSGTPIP